jgi:hypothetical protein
MGNRNCTEDGQFSFFYNHIPTFRVIEAVPTRNWHPVSEARDIFEEPEWALYLFLAANAITNESDPIGRQLWSVIQIAEGDICAAMSLGKSSLQRRLKRLMRVHFIERSTEGTGPGKASVYKVYNKDTVDQIVSMSRCTHYCKQGDARKLYRAKLTLVGPVGGKSQKKLKLDQ